jgi:hypothetical protein
LETHERLGGESTHPDVFTGTGLCGDEFTKLRLLFKQRCDALKMDRKASVEANKASGNKLPRHQKGFLINN